MTGVLVLAHGSRNNETEATLERIVAYAREDLGIAHIEPAYMEFREVNLEKGLLKLVNQGITQITVVPYFLFEGIHIKEDIPQEIEAFREKYPHVTVSFGKTLGTDKRLAQVLADRIREAM